MHQAQLRCSSSGFGAKKKKRQQRESNLGLGAESQAPHHCAAPLFVLVGRRRHRRRGGAGGIVPPSALLATRRAYVDQRLSPRHQTRVRADGRSHLRSICHATPRLGSSCLASMANTHAAGRPAPPPRVPPLPGSPGREERAALDSSPTPTAGDGGAGRAAATGRGRRKRGGFPAFPAAWRNTSRTRAHTDPESRTEFLAHHVLV